MNGSFGVRPHDAVANPAVPSLRAREARSSGRALSGGLPVGWKAGGVAGLRRFLRGLGGRRAALAGSGLGGSLGLGESGRDFAQPLGERQPVLAFCGTNVVLIAENAALAEVDDLKRGERAELDEITADGEQGGGVRFQGIKFVGCLSMGQRTRKVAQVRVTGKRQSSGSGNHAMFPARANKFQCVANIIAAIGRAGQVFAATHDARPC